MCITCTIFHDSVCVCVCVRVCMCVYIHMCNKTWARHGFLMKKNKKNILCLTHGKKNPSGVLHMTKLKKKHQVFYTWKKNMKKKQRCKSGYLQENTFYRKRTHSIGREHILVQVMMWCILTTCIYGILWCDVCIWWCDICTWWCDIRIWCILTTCIYCIWWCDICIW